MKKVLGALLFALLFFLFQVISGDVYKFPDYDHYVSDSFGKFIASDSDLSEGDSFSTGISSGAEFVFFDKARLRLDESTEISVDALSSSGDSFDIQIRLLSGRAWLYLPDMPGTDSRFYIHSGDGVLDAKNGSYVIRRDGDSTKISVARHYGIVRLLSSDSEFVDYLFDGDEFVYDSDFKTKRGNLNHSDREDAFFALNFQKDIKLLDTQSRKIDFNLNSIAGVLPHEFLYSFSQFYESLGTSDESSLAYAHRHLAQSITYAKSGRSGLAEEQLSAYVSEMTDLNNSVSSESFTAWMNVALDSSFSLGVDVAQNTLRNQLFDFVFSQYDPQNLNALKLHLSERMLSRVFDYDSQGFSSEATDAYNIYYSLSSDVFRSLDSQYIDDLVHHVLVFEGMSDSLSPRLDTQFNSLRVEYLALASSVLSSIEDTSDIATYLIDGLSDNEVGVVRYVLLEELANGASGNLLSVVTGMKQDVLDTMRREYVSISTPEERRGYISALYFSFDQSDDPFESFLVIFKSQLSSSLANEIDVMQRGSVYVPPAALSKLEMLREVISDEEYDQFLEDIRYRGLDEAGMIRAIDLRFDRAVTQQKLGNRIRVVYESNGKTRTANVPVQGGNMVETSDLLILPSDPVDNVVTPESEIEEPEIVSEVITE